MAVSPASGGPDTVQVRRLESRVRELEREVSDLNAEHERSRQYWEHLEAIIDHAPLAIYLKDALNTYLLVNHEYERLSGHRRSEILGRNDFEIFEEPVARLFRSQDEEVTERGVPVEFRETIPLPDGVHTFITSKFPLLSKAGELRGVAGVCTDITELERAKCRLEQAQAELVKQARLATLGELTAVIAHEVRNPLGVVFNALAALRRLVPPTGQADALLDIVAAEADRLNRMVHELLELARPPQACAAPAEIERVAAAAIAAARTLADPGAEVRLVLPEPVPAALVDEQLLQQALVNLVLNALQAARPRRPVTVTVRVELVAAAGVLRFVVSDDGTGVLPEHADSIFDPFFTTKAAGTGLGLAVVKHVAEAHRGSVWLEQTPGGGATFLLQVPFRPAERGEG